MPEDEYEARRVRIRAEYYMLINVILFGKCFTKNDIGSLVMCLSPKQVNLFLQVICKVSTIISMVLKALKQDFD